jgi:uncharacterized membrane protein YesL
MTSHLQSDSLFDHLDKVGTFVIANLLWILLSLPLITMPTMTAALFAVFSRWVRGKDVKVFDTYWEAIRLYWRKSTLVFTLDLIVGALVFTNLSLFSIMERGNPIVFLSQCLTIMTAVLVLMVNLYVWPLMVMSDMSVKTLLSTSLRLAVGHLLWSLFLLIAVFSIVTVSYLLPAAVTVLFSASACALLISWGAWRVIRKYVPEHELVQLEMRTLNDPI